MLPPTQGRGVALGRAELAGWACGYLAAGVCPSPPRLAKCRGAWPAAVTTGRRSTCTSTCSSCSSTMWSCGPPGPAACAYFLVRYLLRRQGGGAPARSYESVGM